MTSTSTFHSLEQQSPQHQQERHHIYISVYIYCGRRQGGVRGLGIERRHLATCWLHPQALHGLPPINEAGLKAIKLECLLLKKE